MSDPTLAKIVIDHRMQPGTTRYSSAEGVWRVHSEHEARVVSEDRSRWVWTNGSFEFRVSSSEWVLPGPVVPGGRPPKAESHEQLQ